MNKMYQPKHLKKIKKHRYRRVNFYWDVRLWAPFILIAFIISLKVNGNIVKKNYEAEYLLAQETMTEPVETTEEAVPETTESLEESDTKALAVLADSVGQGRTDEVKKIIMWIAINRSEDRANGYGDSLQTEIARPKQWQQYNPDGIYTSHTYDLATEVYKTWRTNGPRPIYNDMLWFVLNGDGSITVRNRFGNDKNRAEATFGQ